MKYAFLQLDMSLKVCSRLDQRDGGWSTPPFPARWLARKWARIQGYQLIED